MLEQPAAAGMMNGLGGGRNFVELAELGHRRKQRPASERRCEFAESRDDAAQFREHLSGSRSEQGK